MLLGDSKWEEEEDAVVPPPNPSEDFTSRKRIRGESRQPSAWVPSVDMLLVDGQWDEEGAVPPPEPNAHHPLRKRKRLLFCAESAEASSCSDKPAPSPETAVRAAARRASIVRGLT